MKPLTEKILEAGLVDSSLAKLMERWGSINRGETDSVEIHKITRDTLYEFVEQIAELVDSEGPITETILKD